MYIKKTPAAHLEIFASSSCNRINVIQRRDYTAADNSPLLHLSFVYSAVLYIEGIVLRSLALRVLSSLCSSACLFLGPLPFRRLSFVDFFPAGVFQACLSLSVRLSARLFA